MRLFVTGSESFIGSVLMRQCAEAGIETVGVDLAQGEGANRHVADIRSSDIADLIPEGGSVIHLAALSRDSDCRNNALSCFDVNVMGTLSLMEAAAKRNCRQFVFASSEWVYDSFDPNKPKTENEPIDALALGSEYALSKLVSEANLRQRHSHGFCDTTILRFGIIYGPRTENWSAVESLTNAVATQEEVTVGSVRTARAFIHVEDIATGIRAAIGAEGLNTFNLQGKLPIPLDDVIASAARHLDKNPRIVETAPDNPSIRYVSATKAKQSLGWEPAIDIDEGIASILPALGFATEAR